MFLRISLKLYISPPHTLFLHSVEETGSLVECPTAWILQIASSWGRLLYFSSPVYPEN